MRYITYWVILLMVSCKALGALIFRPCDLCDSLQHVNGVVRLVHNNYHSRYRGL